MIPFTFTASIPNAQLATIQLGASANDRSLNLINSLEQSSSIKTYPRDQSTYSGVIDQMVENWNRDLYMPSVTNLGKAFDWIMGWSLDKNGNKNPSIFDRASNLFTKTFNSDSLSESSIVQEKVDLKLSEHTKKVESEDLSSWTYDPDPNSSSCTAGKMEMTHYGVYCASDNGIIEDWQYDVNNTFPTSQQKEDYCRCIYNQVVDYYFLDVSSSSPYCEFNSSFSEVYSSMPQGTFHAWRWAGLYNNQHHIFPSNEVAEFCFDANYNRTSQTQFQPITVYYEGSLKSASGFYDVAYRDMFCSLSYTKQNWTLELSSDFLEGLKSYPDAVLEYSQCLVHNIILPYFQNQNSEDCYRLRNTDTLSYPIPSGTMFRIFATEGISNSELYTTLNEDSLNSCYNQYSTNIEIAKKNEIESKSHKFLGVVLMGGVMILLCTGSVIYYKHKHDSNKRNL